MVTTVPATVALDQSVCIQKQSNIGSTVMHNICDGTSAVVPWGSADWAGFVGLCGVAGLFAFLVGALFLMIARDVY